MSSVKRRPLGLLIVGDSSKVEALAEQPWPRSDFAPVSWASDSKAAAALIDRPNIDAAVVLGNSATRIETVAVALEAGKGVLCTAPLDTSPSDIDRLGSALREGTPLVTASVWCHTPAGRHAIKAVAGEALGELHSIYVGARGPRAASVSDLEWWAADFVMATLKGNVRRVNVMRSQFSAGGAYDSSIIIARFDDDCVATLDISPCLPPGYPRHDSAEISIELIGSTGALRLKPNATRVEIYGMSGNATRNMTDDPISSMLDALDEAIKNPPPTTAWVDRQRRLMSFVSAVNKSAATGAPIELESTTVGSLRTRPN